MTDSSSNNHVIEDEITLKEILQKINYWFKFLYSKRFIILITALIGGALGFGYSITQQPVYTASTIFVLEDEKGGGGLGNLAGLAAMAGVDVGGGGGGMFQGDNILQLYKSRTMLEKTLLTSIFNNGKKQLLVDRFITFNKLRDKWEDEKKLNTIKFDSSDGFKVDKPDRLRDSILGTIVEDLKQNYLVIEKPDKKLNTLKVDIKSSDEVFSKLFNEELVRNVNEFYISTKTKKTLQNVQILQQKTDSVRAVMNGAIYTAVSIGDATPNLNPTRQVQRVAPVQKAQFSAETNKAILAEMAKNLEISKISLLKETPLIQVIDQPKYPLKKEQFGKIKGVVLGMIFASLLALIFFIVKKIGKDAFN